MSGGRQNNHAEIQERFMRRISVLLLLFSIKYGVEAFEALFDSALLGQVENSISVIVIVLGTLLMIHAYMQRTLLDCQNWFSSDSFVAQSVMRATGSSWVITWMMLSAWVIFSKGEKDLFGLTWSSEFFLLITLSLMMMSFSLRFFYLNYDNGDEETVTEQVV